MALFSRGRRGRKRQSLGNGKGVVSAFCGCSQAEEWHDELEQLESLAFLAPAEVFPSEDNPWFYWGGNEDPTMKPWQWQVAFSECFLQGRLCSKHFTHISTLSPHGNPPKLVLLPPSFHRRGNWGTGGLSSLSKSHSKWWSEDWTQEILIQSQCF